jgi:hypothetical protein
MEFGVSAVVVEVDHPEFVSCTAPTVDVPAVAIETAAVPVVVTTEIGEVPVTAAIPPPPPPDWSTHWVL